jgi:hypothetical protein
MKSPRLYRPGARHLTLVAGARYQRYLPDLKSRLGMSRLQTQSGPPDDDSCEHYGGGEVGGELVVAGGDAPPILEAAEHAFDEIALAVGDLVKGMMPFAGRIVRNDRDSPALTQEAPEPIAVISRVGGQATARWNSADQSGRDADIAEMSRGHFDGDGASAPIDDGVDFRGAAAARAANRLRLGPPFPPAAERCALAVVLSMA